MQPDSHGQRHLADRGRRPAKCVRCRRACAEVLRQVLIWSKKSRGARRLRDLSPRLRAADGLWQRRWIRLIFASRNGMTGNRRGLPRSKVAGHRPRPMPHRTFEGSPCGRAHPLLAAEGDDEFSGVVQRLFGCDRPDEAGELTRAGDDDLLVRLAAGSHPPPAPVQALLGAPGALDHRRVGPTLAAGQPIADFWLQPRVPGGLDQKTADVGIADLGDQRRSAA
jgi:hypothetical protein